MTIIAVISCDSLTKLHHGAYAPHPAELRGEKKRSLGRDYHPLCLKCQKCNRQLTAGQHAEYDEKPFCTHCYMKLFGPRAHR
uniref:Zgc:195282 n=1 Tax=Cyprinodon variegatus TaxID=28743 RepID=A0A3Q2GJG4_CYPVA